MDEKGDIASLQGVQEHTGVEKASAQDTQEHTKGDLASAVETNEKGDLNIVSAQGTQLLQLRHDVGSSIRPLAESSHCLDAELKLAHPVYEQRIHDQLVDRVSSQLLQYPDLYGSSVDTFTRSIIKIARQSDHCFNLFANLIRSKLETQLSIQFLRKLFRIIEASFAYSIRVWRRTLPVFNMRDSFIAAIANCQVLLVVGKKGSGKTSQIPQYLVDAGCYGDNQTVACPQPGSARNLISIARRVANELGVELGTLVGFVLDTPRYSCFSTGTAIKFMSEVHLLGESSHDTDLSAYSAIFIDDIQEQRADTQLLLGLLKETLQRRSSLRLIMSSAIVDTIVPGFFPNCNTLEIPESQLPVQAIQLAEVYAKDTQLMHHHDVGSVQGTQLLQLHHDVGSSIHPLVESIHRLNAELPPPVDEQRLHDQLTDLVSRQLLQQHPDLNGSSVGTLTHSVIKIARQSDHSLSLFANLIRRRGMELSIPFLRKLFKIIEASFAYSIRMRRRTLPISNMRDSFIAAIANNQVLLVVGNKGSGKTSQIPQYLVDAGCYGDTRMIACPQPGSARNLISIAQRVANEMGVELGTLVGFALEKPRYSCFRTGTAIKFMSEVHLLGELSLDTDLSHYSAIFIDDIHEQRSHTQLLLGLLKETLKRRSWLRLIMSSAIVDTIVPGFFPNCITLEIPESQLPIQLTELDAQTQVEGNPHAVMQQGEGNPKEKEM
ncbi:hypothetical protein GOP47_0014992 [Adiantum capillus-veneris]|uniref:Helicase ATP-binding domain-containing protein n=2 Tax=Adiantum capillus-veneris TaxID=13818 RepID=A0A9D4UN42_ADICA|nr:hypothetical protein GOP47_0014992 [Adiantum capillus-veneris]